MPPARFVPAGRTSPSGNFTKRARVEASRRPGDPSDQDGDPRPINPLPIGKTANKKKRKHPDVPSPAPVPSWKQVDRAEPGPAMRWPSQPLPVGRRQAETGNDVGVQPPVMRATTPMYPPSSFPGPPFSLQPPYAPHAGFAGPPYGPSLYPPYGPPGWARQPQHSTHQQWPHGPQQFNAEEYEAMMQMCQGSYQG